MFSKKLILNFALLSMFYLFPTSAYADPDETNSAIEENLQETVPEQIDNVPNILDKQEEEDIESEEYEDEKIYPELSTIGDKTDNNIELVYDDGIERIVYDRNYGIYMDANGTVDDENLSHYGLGNYKPDEEEIEKDVQINIHVDWGNCDASEPILSHIQVNLTGTPSSSNGEEQIIKIGEFNLTERNSFSDSQIITSHSKLFYGSVELPLDYSGAYEAKLLLNSTETSEFSALVPQYDLVVLLNKPDYTIIEANDAPELNEKTWNNIADGSYAESRAAELAIDYEKDISKNESIEDEKKSILPFIIGGLIVFILIGGSVFIIWKKKNEYK